MKQILLTGANGFIGQSLAREVISRGWGLRAAIRTSSPGCLPAGTEIVKINSMGAETDWSRSLTGIDTVMHLAARVHVMKDTASDPMTEFRRTNVAGTESLARCAAQSGVKRFIFISSIKVNGEGRNEPYTERDQPKPADPYAVSKWEAEQLLFEISSRTGMEVVVVRPPLVYGPGVKANFLRLIKGVTKGIPFPFGAIENRRSFVYLGNLVDAIMTCASHPKAAGNTFLVSDGVSLSTRELVLLLAKKLDKKARLLSISPSLLRAAGALCGKAAAVDRLTGSLTIDDSKIRCELGWTPPFTLEEAMEHTVRWFTENQCR